MEAKTIELFKGYSGTFIIQEQGKDGAKATSVKIATPKQVAAAFALPAKHADIAIKREAAGEQLKSEATMRAINNQTVKGKIVRSIVERSSKSGTTETITYFTPAKRSATENAILQYLASKGITAEDLAALEKSKAPKAPIDVASTSTPAAPVKTPELTGVGA